MPIDYDAPSRSYRLDPRCPALLLCCFAAPYTLPNGCQVQNWTATRTRLAFPR